jgi:hypothetical protein
MARARKPKSPFYRFNPSPEVIRLVVLTYVRFPLPLHEDLLLPAVETVPEVSLNRTDLIRSGKVPSDLALGADQIVLS